VAIFARMTPDQKLELVDALQERGEVVAVTGDGVNDAPALHRADIGVAMGRGGTDAAKEAADLVITDDNLATIVSAIHEGRGIYDNIRKVVEYLVAANISEVLVVLATLILFPEVGVPLLPLQLLWINLITDGLPAIALGVDPVADDLMQRAPRSRDDTLVNRSRIGLLVTRGASLALVSLLTLVVVHYGFDDPWSHARSAMFVTLALSQLAYSFAVRGPSRSGHGVGASIRRLFANRWLIWGAASGLVLQVAAVHWAPLVELLGTAPLDVKQWILVTACAVAPSILMIWMQPALGPRGRLRSTRRLG
jgi:Ca2+-transporting ATPase